MLVFFSIQQRILKKVLWFTFWKVILSSFLRSKPAYKNYFWRIMWHWRLEKWCWKFYFASQEYITFENIFKSKSIILVVVIFNTVSVLQISQINAVLASTRDFFQNLKKILLTPNISMVEHIWLCNSCFSLSYKSDRTLTFSPADIRTVHVSYDLNHVLEERAEGSDWIKQIKSSEGNSNQQCLWQVCQEAVSIIHVRLDLCCWFGSTVMETRASRYFLLFS